MVFWCVCGSETKPYFLLQPPSTLQVLCLLISPAEELEAHSISQLHSLTLFLAPLASPLRGPRAPGSLSLPGLHKQ